jgi:parallel beta-helix repeat protein
LGAALCFIVLPVAAAARTIDVSPEAVGGRSSALAQLDWRALAPGDEVVLQRGRYRQPIVISGRGSASAPILIRAAPGADVVVENSVVLDGAAFVVVEGLKIRGAEHSGVILRNASSDITIRNTVVSDSGLGIWIGGGAGMRHRIVGNVIHDNKTHGIAVDRVSNDPGSETVIADNRIYNNATHGIEIIGSRFIVERNIVHNNGLKHFGASGIHLYAGGFQNSGEIEGLGDHNVIRFNVSYDNKDPWTHDGNGIQADIWCDDNEIYSNVAFGNDGAGITIFGSKGNAVFGNLLVANMRDPGRTHTYKGEIVLATEYTRQIDRTENNEIIGNVILPTSSGAAGIFADRFTVRKPLTIENNLIRHYAAGALLAWGGSEVRSIEDLNRSVRAMVPNVGDDPRFTDILRPLDGGLALSPGSPAAERLQALLATGLLQAERLSRP